MPYIVTHSAYFDKAKGIDTKEATRENGPVFNTADDAADFIRRSANCGCTDAKATELTPAEYRALVMARMPPSLRK